MDKSKQQEHSESSSAQIPKQEHSTKHAVKKDLEHLNTVRLVTRRVSTGNKEHSRKKHKTDQERRRTRRKRGGKTMSLNLAPSVQEEEKRGEKIERRQEEIGKVEITLVRSVSLSRSYLSFRCNYIRGRTNRRIEYQYQGDLKSGQRLVESRNSSTEYGRKSEGREGREGREEREEREGREGELDSSRRWKQLGLSVCTDIEDWRHQTLYTSSEESGSTGIESEVSSRNSSICDDVTTDDDVIKFEDGDVTSVRRVRSLAPFQALPINVITDHSFSDTYVAQVSTFSDSDSEDESAQLNQQHVEKDSAQHVLNNLTQHVQESGRETGMFIKNGRLDKNINSDVAYKHFPHFREKRVWVKPPMFRNFL